MIGTSSVAALAPLDYRYALDASMAVLGGKAAPTVLCNAPELACEVRQRIPSWGGVERAGAALWVEPLVDTWRAELATLRSALPGDAPLAVIASRPLARLLPERHMWGGRPLGLQPSGIGYLRGALLRAGFRLETVYGIHSALAIWLSLLGRQAERWGYPNVGDRLHFAARLRYCTSGPLAALSTVALLIARKGCG